jgi:hypothetical protein
MQASSGSEGVEQDAGDAVNQGSSIVGSEGVKQDASDAVSQGLSKVTPLKKSGTLCRYPRSQDPQSSQKTLLPTSCKSDLRANLRTKEKLYLTAVLLSKWPASKFQNSVTFEMAPQLPPAKM